MLFPVIVEMFSSGTWINRYERRTYHIPGLNAAANWKNLMEKNLWNQQQLHLLGSSLRGSHGFVTAATASVYVWICSDILSGRRHMFNNNTDPWDPWDQYHTCTPKKSSATVPQPQLGNAKINWRLQRWGILQNLQVQISDLFLTWEVFCVLVMLKS